MRVTNENKIQAGHQDDLLYPVGPIGKILLLNSVIRVILWCVGFPTCTQFFQEKTQKEEAVLCLLLLKFTVLS
jgi:hypothetical protein